MHHPAEPAAPTVVRRRIRVRGRVQGVGFRPFVWRLATELQVAGTVANSPAGVVIEVEGDPAVVAVFVDRLRCHAPPRADVVGVESETLAVAGDAGFTIGESLVDDATDVRLSPDLAICPACRADLADPANRRHGYPFTVCTDCGPRWSILDDLPWDRPRTAMAAFPMCPDCRDEYGSPPDRRFHAEPIACPTCGPQMESSIPGAAAAIRAGQIVALKGIGGFQLLCDATNETAVATLRERKLRPMKPLAVMVPSLDAARELCDVSPAAAELLASPEAPIVLLPSRRSVAPNVAPGVSELGVMLPTTPLHILLLAELDTSVVCTSGNRSGEPIATDAAPDFADHLLTHNRPIRRPVDDSVARIVAGAPAVIRSARGLAPLTLELPATGPTVLAVGAHLKSTVALAVGDQLIVSPHIGDVDSAATARVHRETIDTLLRLTRVTPDAIAHDLHPDYHSTRVAHELADRFGVPAIPVQHHHAHAAAVVAEHAINGPALAVTWDGTGCGTDGTVWGGEFLAITGGSFDRVAHLRPFRLPGGDAAARDPRRSALGLLHALDEPDPFGHEWSVVRAALERGINAPTTTSAGRLFDALAALLGICTANTFEGEAAMRLEHAQRQHPVAVAPPFPMPFIDGVLDPAPMVRAVLARDPDDPADWLAARIHATLIDGIRTVAAAVGRETVILTGGCFQNVTLLTGCVAALEAAGHRVWTPRRVPANDGGIAVGQAWLARQLPQLPPLLETT